VWSKTELTGRSLLRGVGPHWTVEASKKMKWKNVGGPIIIVVQTNVKRKFSHDRHVVVPYRIKDYFLSYFFENITIYNFRILN
jgi:hypothetical protein